MIHGVDNQKPGLFQWFVLGMPLVVLLGISGCAKISHQMRYHMHFGYNRPLPGLPYYHCTHCGQIVPKAGHECGIMLSHGPFFGYNATCWRDWPEGWVACPIQEIHPVEVIEIPAEQSGGPQPPRAPATYPGRAPAFSARPSVPVETQTVQELAAMPWSAAESDAPDEAAPADPPTLRATAGAPAANETKPRANDWVPRQSRSVEATPELIPERVMRLEADDDIQSVLSEPTDASDGSAETPEQTVRKALSWDDVTAFDPSQRDGDGESVGGGSPQPTEDASPKVAASPDVRKPAPQLISTRDPQPVDTPAKAKEPVPAGPSVKKASPPSDPQPVDTPAKAKEPAPAGPSVKKASPPSDPQPVDTPAKAKEPAPADPSVKKASPPSDPQSDENETVATGTQSTGSRQPAPQYSAVPPAPLPGRSLPTLSPSSSDAKTSGHGSQQGRGLIDWRTSSATRLDSVARRLETVRKSSTTQVYMVGVAPRQPVSVPSAASGDSAPSILQAAPSARPDEPVGQLARSAAGATVRPRRTRTTVSRTIRHRSQLRTPQVDEDSDGATSPDPEPVAAPTDRPEPIRVRLIGYGDESLRRLEQEVVNLD